MSSTPIAEPLGTVTLTQPEAVVGVTIVEAACTLDPTPVADAVMPEPTASCTPDPTPEAAIELESPDAALC